MGYAPILLINVIIMIERTLLLVKPDGVYRALVGKIISQMEDTGLKMVAIKMVWPDKQLAGKHYIYDLKWLTSVGTKTHSSYKDRGIILKETPLQIGERVRGYLITLLTSGPIVAMVFEGNDAIPIVRKLIGATEPKKADPYSLRGRFSSDSYDLAEREARAILNLVHASEDAKTSAKEISVWFKKSEIVDYKRADEKALYFLGK
jgi:nucleoside-diphosphate kinase